MRNNKQAIVGAVFIVAGILGALPLILQETTENFFTFFTKPPSYNVITKNIPITGTAAFVYEINTQKELYADNANTALPLASITKVMAAVVAAEELTPNTPITIKAEDLALPEAQGLVLNEEWQLKDLLNFGLITSSNDAFNAIGRKVFEETGVTLPALMNKKAKMLGLTNTTFYNETGLDLPNGKNGGYSTCREVSLLLSYAYTAPNNVLAITGQPNLTVRSLSGIEHKVNNTDVLASKISWLKAGKTGLTRIAGGNLAVIAEPRADKPVAVCVLGSTETARFVDVEALITTLIEETS
jgi:D-alanyl-D-alanine carboxypeptidase